ncbi:hypothetical protein P3W85_16350 [Cupriavidus basilensis]|uniref:Uncharacterized protein n=1 Tax=Cupriavidus basilensis TaxID=68895 RepID=A0ABT6APG3_9BURK|nr:hypothetical protein [Cupriavidus basilensis]MDF3834514.1 hypothetical protein [Cupriavidus basilensis]
MGQILRMSRNTVLPGGPGVATLNGGIGLEGMLPYGKREIQEQMEAILYGAGSIIATRRLPELGPMQAWIAAGQDIARCVRLELGGEPGQRMMSRIGGEPIRLHAED